MINIIVVREGIVDENILCKDEAEAKEVFKHFDDMLDKSPADIDEAFAKGFTWVTGGSICISTPETVGKIADVCETISQSSKTKTNAEFEL